MNTEMMSFDQPCDTDNFCFGGSEFHTLTDTFRLIVAIVKESEDYSALSLNLPGVFSNGDTEEEALDNIKESFLLAIESYRENKKEIPWSENINQAEDDAINEYPGCKIRRVIVDAKKSA